jgi:hypothetical protein
MNTTWARGVPSELAKVKPTRTPGSGVRGVVNTTTTTTTRKKKSERRKS